MKKTNNQTMKKLLLSCQILMIVLLSVSYSCKRDEPNNQQIFKDIPPKNVRLSNYLNTSINVAWLRAEGVDSYTVQLLGSKDSETPIHAYTTVSRDFYQFDNIEEVRGYYVRVRANFDKGISEWAYIMDGSKPARIMPKFGIVTEDFVAPDPALQPVRDIYPNFPEGWEDNNMQHFTTYVTILADAIDEYPSGKWMVYRAQRNNGTTIGRRNTFGMMGQNNQTSTLGMEFDLPNGASKLSFYISTATINDTNMGDLVVEYSVDSGVSWTEHARYKKTDGIPWKRDMDDPMNYKEFVLDIRGNVRFRFTYNSAGVGASPGSRWTIDDVAVYQNIN